MTQTTLREYLRTTEDAISSGHIDEAMANCQNVLTYFPEALEAQRLLGEVYLAQGQLEEAKQTFEWVLTNDPENVIVYCDRALISERSSDIDTALDCYQQAYELSRGNANIRQEFNQLSARAGQQEFMFSRAGLARLYMRGDLLTQAIQEWDAVLAISPERLDARLGLMETYWREGMYEKAEGIATLLLEEIPTCLKALLYLAHITSISNVQRAHELLRRAEALDPDLTMAQEVFADLAARQPNDPFLQLLKKEPILMENGVPINFQPISQPAAPASTQTQVAPGAPLSPYSDWETQSSWNMPTQDISAPAMQPIPETPSRANWSNEAETLTNSNPAQPELPSWMEQMETQAPAAQTEQPWYQSAQSFPTTAHVTPDWSAQENVSPTPLDWNNETQEEEQIAHPAWLDTLTRSEQQPVTESTFQEPAAPLPNAQAAVTPTRPTPTIQPQQQAQLTEEPTPFFFPSEDENESEMGWPEWLKSLGAEALEPEQTTPSEPLPEVDATPVRPVTEKTNPWDAPQPVEASQPAPDADPWASLPAMSANNDAWTEPNTNSQPDWIQQFSPTQSATPDWMQQSSPAQSVPAQSTTPDWMQQFPGVGSQPYQAPAAANMGSGPLAAEEQRYIASLEDLEKDLQSQGFAPLAPGSLASIAQAQQSAPDQPGMSVPQQPEPQAQTSLSSALAQLGNFSQPPMAPTTNEPWWNSIAPQAAEQPTQSMPQAAGEAVNPFAALGARPAETEPQSFAPLPATPAPIPQAQPFTPNTSQEAPAPPLSPVYRSDALLDSDLETTMKRPAITLQPMQAGAAQSDRPYANGKGRGERKHIERADDSNLSSHERLVKGYQYQLSGAYDEAMQEYRVIIRNAPELLEDVISNLRALLKINPHFSLGYRVQGDAYMRKGEYLQAMESYNKALTMAKKGKN